ncbi:glutaredoxin family protein [Piscicoccus intestinalis]|uniref:glutaredoxin family protein n=1 Tax=Piscicoccus intestinalis TaxID=746033 RepID=UPI000838776D|nr:glutaredoxin family protein [Piscicoccus intestinalis]
MSTDEPRVTLITKPGCHLCTLAREVVVRVTDELGVGWQEQSILDVENPDPMWWEQLPITLVDGRPHDYWRVSEGRLRTALTASGLRSA